MDAKAIDRSERRRFPWLRLLIGLGACAGLAALQFVPGFAPWLSRLDHWTADWRTAYLSPVANGLHPQVATVVINDDTLKDFASSPIDRGLLAKIVSAIDAAGARAIGIDIFFLKKTEPEKDAALIDALRKAKATIIMGVIDERGELQDFQRQFQAEFLAATGRPAGYLNLRHEKDDVVRYTASPGAGSVFPKSFARLLAEAAGSPDADDAGKPVPWLRPPIGASDAFTKLAAQDLFATEGGGVSRAARRLKDRIVLLGGDFPLRDRHRVPLSVRDGEPMAGVMIHAQIVAGLLDGGRTVSELDPLRTRVFLSAIAVLGFWLGWSLWQSSVASFFGWTFASILLIAADALCFVELRIVLPFTLALVAWVLGLAAGRSAHAVSAAVKSPGRPAS